MTRKSENLVDGKEYQKVPPEGGWGYIVTFSICLMFVSTTAPMSVFGLVFGEFLQSIGDETTGITLASGILSTAISFTGLPANYLLQRISFRQVGLIGAAFYFTGAFTSIFVTNITELIISYSVLQGLGFGLMMPAVFTAFNHYFVERRTFLMSVAQSGIAAATMIWPFITKILLETYGFRGTVAVFSAFSLNCFLAMIVLQPVEWHMKKRKLSLTVLIKEQLKLCNVKSTTEKRASECNFVAREEAGEKAYFLPVMDTLQNAEVKSHGKENMHLWKVLVRSLDLKLFKDPVYINIVIGLSLSIISDLTFISILPMLLVYAKLDTQEITIIMTIYFASDLVSRMLLSVLSVLVQVNGRYAFLAGAMFSAIFRTAFIMNNTFWWLASTTAALGFLRCFIQTTPALIFAERYPAGRFATAFSLHMVVCGVVATISGPMLGFIKRKTQSVELVVHILTAAYLLCAIPWLIEILTVKLSSKKRTPAR